MVRSGNLPVLLITTWAFTVCFAVWMMFGVIGIPIRAELGLNSTEFGFLTATPVLTGAIFRLPLGIWTDRFGGRIIMLLLLICCAVPLWLSSYATALFNMFVAPWLIEAYGWQMVPKVYAVALLVTAVLFWVFSAPDPGVGGSVLSMWQQLSVLRNPRVWKYCQYYSIVFGGFTALSIWMPQYFKTEYGFTIAQASLLAACFSLPGGAFRAIGGWLSDRFGAHNVTWWVLWAAWVCLFLLSYPKTDLIVHTVNDPLSFHIALPSWFFTMLLFTLGIAFACGMASTFKYIGDEFPDSMGAVSGIVGMAGGLGGFLLPIMFGANSGRARCELELLHAALRHHLGVADTQLSDRSPANAGHGRKTSMNSGGVVALEHDRCENRQRRSNPV